MMSNTTVSAKSTRWIFGIMAVFAIAGLGSAFVLSVEKLELLKNPDAILSCSLNVWLNCASVMKTWQSQVFGFPNSYIGMICYPIVLAVAIGKLTGVKYGRIYMFLFQIGTLLGLIFAYWLFFQSVIVIQVLCPWCLVVTVSTTLIFESLLRYNILQNNLYLPAKWHDRLSNWLRKDYDKMLIVGWLVAMLGLVLVKFPQIFG